MKELINGWTIFRTSIGYCGISWNECGITSFQLPDTSLNQIENRLKNITGNTNVSMDLPFWIRNLIKKIKAYMQGIPQDFIDVPLAFGEITEFRIAVYMVTRRISFGKVITYSDLAEKIGRPDAVRAVGNALAKNPIPLIIPCHRVILSSGRLGGYSAYSPIMTKADLLEIEGIYLRK